MGPILSVIGTLISLLVVGTTLWVGLDASRLMNGIPKAKRLEIGGTTFWSPRSPAGWVAGFMLLWIMYFPWYLFKRQEYLAFQRGRFMEEYNRQKAEGLEPLSWDKAEASKKTPFPVMAFVLIAVNIIVWVVMQGSGGSSEPLVLVRFGAQLNELVAAGQYWRLFTAMFLHIGLEHLAFNCLALMLFAPIIESTYGKVRFLLLYLLSGYTGNILFFALGRPEIVSAGASGAIFGILGAHIPLSRRLKEEGLGGMGARGLAGYGYLLWVLVRSIGPGVNIPAHLGGVVAGIILGSLLYPRAAWAQRKGAEPEAVRASAGLRGSVIRVTMEARPNWALRGAVIGVAVLALTVPCALLSPAGKERAESTPIRVGEKARDLTLKTVGGKSVNIGSFKGKKVLVLGVANPYG